MQPVANAAGPRLWAVLEDGKRPPGERLRAACALAEYDPNDARWPAVSRDVAARLVAEPGHVIARWADALWPVRRFLLPPLATLLVDDGQDAAGRRTITGLYGDYAEGLPEAFAALEKEAAQESGPAADPDDRLVRQRRQADAAVALASLGRWQSARSLMRDTREPTVRSYLIDRLGSGGAEAEALLTVLSADGDRSVRRAALLALAEFGEDRLPLPARERLAPRLVELYRDDPDPGVHSAAGWVVRQWGQGRLLDDADRALGARGPQASARRWYVNSQGQTMVLIAAGSFQRGPGQRRPQRRIDHGFALASRELTITEFRRFRKDYAGWAEFAWSDDCPVHQVSWYDAAAYCNWLSEQEGIPKEQWCYSPNEQGRYAEGMRVAPDFLTRSGYRLPTPAEWEYACRAGSVTRWSLGEAEDLLTRYAWYLSNAASRLHPVATLRPNDLGLFDMHGNAWEWCQHGEEPGAGVVTDAGPRLAFGGAFGHNSLAVQSSRDIPMPPTEKNPDLGFRPARTIH